MIPDTAIIQRDEAETLLTVALRGFFVGRNEKATFVCRT